MMLRRHSLRSIIIVLVLLVCSAIPMLSGCGGAPRPSAEGAAVPPDRPLVTTTVGYTLSEAQFTELLNVSKRRLSGGTVEADELGVFLDSLIIDTLCGLMADTIDLTKHRLPYRDFKMLYEDALVRKWTEVEISSKVSAYDSIEVLEYFAENPSLFLTKERIRVYQILISGYGLLVGPDSAYYKHFSNTELRDKAKEQIFQVYDLLKYGESFQNMALAFNQDFNSQKSAGLVGWTTRGTYIDPFDSVAFALKVGQFSAPYLDKDGWHIVYIDGYLPDGQLPIDTPSVFEYARQTLLNDKAVKRATAVADSLRQGVTVELNPVIADSNIYRVDDETWCGVINGRDTIPAYVMKWYEEGVRAQYRVDSSNREQKLEVLRMTADRYLAIQAMRDRKLDQDSDVVAFRNSVWRAKTKYILLGGQTDQNWVPTDTMISDYYAAHQSEYVYAKPTNLQFLEVGDSTYATFLRDQALTGLGLDELVREFGSVNPGGKLSASKVLTVGPEDLPQAIWKASVTTPPGGVSDIFKHAGSFVFLKVFDRKESRNLALAKGEILVKLQGDHQRQVFESFRHGLYTQNGVKIHRKFDRVNLKAYWERNKKS